MRLIAEPGTQVLLIRHGETTWNRDQRIQGHQDIPLSDRGREQAALLAAWLAQEPISIVYTSDLQRARQTAEVIADGRIPVSLDARLREARFGSFEGLTGPEIEARYPESYRAWRADSFRNRPPGGETPGDLQERCLAVLQECLPRHPGETVAISTHGGPIRVLVCGLLDLPLTAYNCLRVENTSVSRILYTFRGPMLTSFNEVAHLREAVAPEHTGWEEK